MRDSTGGTHAYSSSLLRASFRTHTTHTPSAQKKKKKDCMQIQLPFFLANDSPSLKML
ncbi:unnamed protein product [Ixodes hexagonus]